MLPPSNRKVSPTKFHTPLDEDASEFKRLVPQVQRENIPGAGHSIRREQYSVYVQTVREFLDR